MSNGSGVSRKMGWLAGLTVVVVAAWSAGWVWLSGEVGPRMDAELEKLARRGVVVTCPNRAVGGYPFRIEIACVRPTLEIAREGLTAEVHALNAVAQIYAPRHVILEAEGPLLVTRADGLRIDAVWAVMRGSVVLVAPGLARVSIAGDTVEAKAESPSLPPSRLTATKLEAHVRPGETPANGLTDLDLAVVLRSAVFKSNERAVGPPPGDYVGLVALSRMPYGPAPLRERLAAWASAGGVATIRDLRYVGGPGGALARVRGTLTPDATGRLSGTLDLGFAALEKLGPGVIDGTARTVVQVLNLVGKPGKDGERDIRTMEVEVDRGRVRVGPARVAEIPPLF